MNTKFNCSMKLIKVLFHSLLGDQRVGGEGAKEFYNYTEIQLISIELIILSFLVLQELLSLQVN